jgi:hypothetical protein
MRNVHYVPMSSAAPAKREMDAQAAFDSSGTLGSTWCGFRSSGLWQIAQE